MSVREAFDDIIPEFFKKEHKEPCLVSRVGTFSPKPESGKTWSMNIYQRNVLTKRVFSTINLLKQTLFSAGYIV